MNCAEWEERVALYAGGDLPPAEGLQVKRHLGECAGCQVFASGVRQSLEMLREAHGDIPLEAHFATVRARVMARVGTRRRLAWLYALTAAAAIVMLAVAVRLEWPAVPPEPVAVLRIPAPPAEALVIPPKAAEPPPVHRTPRPPAEQAQVLIKLVTNDPDVVIYWIADTKGD